MLRATRYECTIPPIYMLTLIGHGTLGILFTDPPYSPPFFGILLGTWEEREVDEMICSMILNPYPIHVPCPPSKKVKLAPCGQCAWFDRPAELYDI